MNICDKEVCVRDFGEADIERKVVWINDPQNNQYLHYDIPLEIDKTKKWFWSKDNSCRADCVIEYLGAPVGLIGLVAIDRHNRKAELYISMGEHKHKRKGIATKAIRLVLEYAFMELKLNKVYLNVDAQNQAACGLYEKIGFKCEGFFVKDMIHRGTLIDRKRYAILRGDYLSERVDII